MAMLGMDVDQATTTANQLNNLSGQLQTLIGQLNSQVSGLSGIWHGTDSTNFTGQTWPTHKTALTNCKTALDQLVNQLKKEIQEQQQTSAS